MVLRSIESTDTAENDAQRQRAFEKNDSRQTIAK